MKKKFLNIVAVIAVVLSPLMSVSIVSAAVDICTWTGATNSNWNDTGNWAGCDGNLPENGDSLIFPNTGLNRSTNNDIPSLSVENISIGGTGYSFSGNALTLTGTVALTATEDATFNNQLTFHAFNVTMSASSNRTVTLNGMTVLDSTGGEVNVGSSGNSGTFNFVGDLVGTAATQFIAVQGATAQVRSATNTFTASTVGAESNGIFDCYSTTCFGDSNNDIYMGGGRVYMHVNATYTNNMQTSASTPDDSQLRAFDSISMTGTLNVNDSIGIYQIGTSKSLQFTGGITLNGSMSVFGTDATSQIRFDATISGTDGISFGGGTSFMNLANSYDGSSFINADSIVIAQNPDAMGNDALGTVVLDGGSLRYDLAAAQTVTEPLTLEGSGISGEGALVMLNESTTFSGNIDLTADTTVSIESAASPANMFFSGVISGSYNITLTADELVDYSTSSIQYTGSSPNTYTGFTTVSGVRFYPDKGNNVIAVPGNLIISATSTKRSEVTTSSNEVIQDDAQINTINNGSQVATLYIGTAATETIGSVIGDGEISIGATSTLILSSNDDYTYAGNISKFANFPAGDSVIRKTGTGVSTLTGGVNSTYGAFYPKFEVYAGTVKMNSSFNLIPMTIGTGGTLKGTGTVGDILTTNTGAVSIGNSPGCMTMSSLTLSPSSTYYQEIAGDTACSGFDQASVTGAVDLGGATLNIALSSTPADNTVFTIITASNITGTFSGLANGSVVTASGVQLRINYTPTTVTLTKVSGTLSNTGTSTLLPSIFALSAIIMTLSLTTVSKRSRI